RTASMFPEGLRARLRNVHIYAVTPFKRDDLLQIDRDAFARNLEFLLARGVQVVTVGGGTGEFEALSNEEQEALALTAFQVVGQRTLVVPTLPGNLKAALELLPRYERLGAEVILAMPPLIRAKPPRDLEGVAEYYCRLAAATELALMPYNTQ